MKYAPILFALVLLSYTTKEDISLIDPVNLEGDGIEFETRMDTLSFDPLDNLTIINLNKGKENRNGRLVPNYRSEAYTHKEIFH